MIIMKKFLIMFYFVFAVCKVSAFDDVEALISNTQTGLTVILTVETRMNGSKKYFGYIFFTDNQGINHVIQNRKEMIIDPAIINEVGGVRYFATKDTFQVGDTIIPKWEVSTGRLAELRVEYDRLRRQIERNYISPDKFGPLHLRNASKADAQSLISELSMNGSCKGLMK